MQVKNLSMILGKTFSKITQEADKCILFNTNDGEEFKMYHEQDCCEGVYINDINGDLQSLIGNPLLIAEERTSDDKNPENPKLELPTGTDESYTWTFYELATIKGSVTIRWIGSSNGYYSESVSLIKTK